eukprot:scaffold192760_cov20-Prasinocladus_malaysianus.AAC.1
MQLGPAVIAVVSVTMQTWHTFLRHARDRGTSRASALSWNDNETFLSFWRQQRIIHQKGEAALTTHRTSIIVP